MKLIIGFSQAKGFKPFSWVIRWFDGTPYSHAYIRTVSDYYDDVDVYQASKGMVNHLLEPTFLEHNNIIAEFFVDVSKEDKKTIIKYLRDRLGRPYSISAVIGIFLAKYGIKINKLFDGENGYICSELVARVLAFEGSIPYGIDFDKITPKQLYELCETHLTKMPN